MNKIILVNDQISFKELNDKIDLIIEDKNEISPIIKLTISIKENSSTDLIIEFNSELETKLNICININENTDFNLYEKRTGEYNKIQYKYHIKENSNIIINKFYDIKEVKELDIINLNGENIKLKYNLSTIATSLEKYDLIINHNYSNTDCIISNHGVSILNGKIRFSITNSVPKNIKNCDISQNSRIIVLNNKKNEIFPNLLIEDNDIMANHSALIGSFREEEIFYLQSRGLNKKECFNLLIKGLLVNSLDIKSKMKKELLKIIDKYWR